MASTTVIPKTGDDEDCWPLFPTYSALGHVTTLPGKSRKRSEPIGFLHFKEPKNKKRRDRKK